ncbi:DUF1080 domain-containing protein [Bacteroidota bacterium]
MKKSLSLLTVLAISMIMFHVMAQDEEPEWNSSLTQLWEPEPIVVTPGVGNAAPSDAIVLFDGKDFSKWETVEDGSKVKWKLEDGAMTVVKGAGGIRTRESFGDCQLHIEWRTPSVVKGEGQDRGNSGVFLQSNYEVQVLDSYKNKTYVNGQAASIYKQSIPLVNASRKPGEWQTYDIIFRAPRFKDDGDLDQPAYITLIHNGVLVQNHFQLSGDTPNVGLPKYKAHGDLPVMLQDHTNPVSYQNIWIRKL